MGKLDDLLTRAVALSERIDRLDVASAEDIDEMIRLSGEWLELALVMVDGDDVLELSAEDVIQLKVMTATIRECMKVFRDLREATIQAMADESVKRFVADNN